MKKLLLLAALAVVFSTCKQITSPKQISQDFIRAVAANDNNTATTLSTAETGPVVATNKTTAKVVSYTESQFEFATMTETINDEKAEVKNNIVSLSLKKESDGWKVVATPQLLSNIHNRQAALEAVKQKWEAVQKEYEARLQVAKEYLQYKKGLGALSAPLQNLEAAVNALTAPGKNKENILAYAQKQKGLDALIDKALEPTYTAGSDLSMNYFIQLNSTGNRIKAAQSEYQAMAEKTPSVLYPLLNTSGPLK